MSKILSALLALLFCASQALAAPAAPSSMVLPASPDADGVYAVRWYSVSGCSYVLQEDRGAGFVQIYAGSNSYVNLTRPQGTSSAFQVKAVNSTGSSAWRAGAYPVVVGKALTPLAPPTALVVPTTVDTPTVRITFDGAPLGAGYALERSADGGATWTQVYTGSNTYYLSGTLTDGASYAFRVRSVQYNYNPSSWYPDANGLSVTVTLPQGPAACIACHDGTDTGAPVVAAAWQAGGHANPNGKPLPGSGSCDNCHNVANAPGATTAQITCQGCHGTGVTNHAPGAYTIGNQLSACNECHKIYDAAGAVTAAGHQNTITDTHFDDPATTNVEGYVIRKGSATPCSDCHGHQAKAAEHLDWAASPHAGCLTAATPATAAVWGHDDWDAADHSACQRCHTATGAANFLNAPATYNASANDLSHLAAGQNELLVCWGCHSDAGTGTLRNPGALTENYPGVNNPSTGTTGAAAQIVYPDLGASNVCVGCHLGREIGQNLANLSDADGVLGFVDSHSLPAGAVIFNHSGYEYSGTDYDRYGFHKQVGVADTFGTGSDGPCVTCHMTSSQPHSFAVVTKSTDVITAITSSACTKCHGGLTAAVLEESRVGFNLALEDLRNALEARGIYYAPYAPYFFTLPYVAGSSNIPFSDWNAVAEALGVGLSTDPTGTGWKNVLGAAFNYSMLAHEPGAYIHNRDYTLKLMATSCDFLADGAVNGSTLPAGIAAALGSGAFSAATTWTAFGHPQTPGCLDCHIIH